jgi:hypothetical protein
METSNPPNESPQLGTIISYPYKVKMPTAYSLIIYFIILCIAWILYLLILKETPYHNNMILLQLC